MLFSFLSLSFDSLVFFIHSKLHDFRWLNNQTVAHWNVHTHTQSSAWYFIFAVIYLTIEWRQSAVGVYSNFLFYFCSLLSISHRAIENARILFFHFYNHENFQKRVLSISPVWSFFFFFGMKSYEEGKSISAGNFPLSNHSWREAHKKKKS